MTLKEERRRCVLDEQDRDAGDEEGSITNADQSPGGSSSSLAAGGLRAGADRGLPAAPGCPLLSLQTFCMGV